MRARIRDTEIYFDVDGMGLVPNGPQMVERPVAFLIHGGPGVDHSGLKGRYGCLTAKMQLVYFDLRGQGRSERGNSEQYTLDQNVEDVEALRLYLGSDSVLTLGTSFGGMVAMAHAARYPKSVSRLILVATAAHYGAMVRAAELVRVFGTAEQVEYFDAIKIGKVDTVEKMRRYFEAMASLYSRRNDPALSGGGLSRCIYSPEALLRAHGPGGYMRSYDIRGELRSIAAPTLILAGRHDYFCAPEFSEEIHRLIQNSQLQIFEDSGHSIAGDEPEKFLVAVNEFLADTQTRPGK